MKLQTVNSTRLLIQMKSPSKDELDMAAEPFLNHPAIQHLKPYLRRQQPRHQGHQLPPLQLNVRVSGLLRLLVVESYPRRSCRAKDN